MLTFVWTVCVAIGFVIVDIDAGGDSVDAVELLSMDADALVVDTGSQQRSIPLDAVEAIRFVDTKTRPPSNTVLRLRGGSVLPVDEVGLRNETVVARPRRIEPLSLPVAKAASLRFAPPRAAADAAWLGYLSEAATTDRMVIRRDGDVLDVIEGIMLSIDADVVTFEIDGDPIEAPTSRLEGIIWAGDAVRDAGDIVVTDAYGVRLRCEKVQLDGGQLAGGKLRCETPIGEVDLDLGNVVSIVQTGVSQTLATMRPVEKKLDLAVVDRLPGELVESFLLPTERNDGSSWRLPAGTTLQYRIDEGLTRFVGSLRRDPASVAMTDLRVLIRLDDKIVFEEALEDSGTKGFEIEIDGQRRLSIEVDGGGDSLLGDRVEMLDVRLTR